MSLPNQLTILRIVLTPVALVLLLMQGVAAKQFATGVFILASLSDLYDGHFARKYGYVTKWGKFFDPLADKLLISTMLFGFAVLKYIKFGWVIIIVLRDIIITALRGYMMVYGKPVSPNLLAKWKTVTQAGLVFALFAYINIEHIIGSNMEPDAGIFLAKFKFFIDKYLLFVVFFTVVTGLIYVIDNRIPIKRLLWRVYRIVVPFRLIMDTKPDNQIYSKSGETIPEVEINKAEAADNQIIADRPAGDVPKPQRKSALRKR